MVFVVMVMFVRMKMPRRSVTVLALDFAASHARHFAQKGFSIGVIRHRNLIGFRLNDAPGQDCDFDFVSHKTNCVAGPLWKICYGLELAPGSS